MQLNNSTAIGADGDIKNGHAGGSVKASDNPLMAPISAKLSLTFERILALVRDYPVATVEAGRDAIHITPKGDGFRIILSDTPGIGMIIEFGGWFEDDIDPQSAKNLVQKALAGEIRVVSRYLRDAPLSHECELKSSDNQWIKIGCISYPRMTIFRKHLIRTMVWQYPATVPAS